MDDNTRDFLMWKNARGRYAVGQKHHGAKAPKEGGALAPEYRASTGTASRPQASAFRSHNGAEPVEAEPIPQAEAVTPYCPPRMERIPGESKNAPDELEQVQGFPEMEPETEAEPARAYFYKMDERSRTIR